MGEEAARLREEIEQTRSDLTRDVDRLTEKTSPARIMERRVQRTRGRLSGLKEKIMGADDAARRPTYGPTYTDDVYDRGWSTAGYPAGGSSTTGSDSGSLRESVTGTASHAADSAKETLAGARSGVAHAGERASGAAHDAVSGVREQTEGSPVAAGVVAFGIGWLVSSLLPASEAETQAAQRAGDAAKEHGGPVLEQAKQAAQEVAGDLKEHAQDAAQQVKERTQDAAGSVREEARSSVSG